MRTDVFRRLVLRALIMIIASLRPMRTSGSWLDLSCNKLIDEIGVELDSQEEKHNRQI